MNDNELNRMSDLLWSRLNCIENQNEGRVEQINMIKTVLKECSQDSIKSGRRQILNHLGGEMEKLK